MNYDVMLIQVFENYDLQTSFEIVENGHRIKK